MKKYVVLGGVLLSLIFALPAFADDQTSTTSTPADEIITDSGVTTTIEIPTDTTTSIILELTTTTILVGTTTTISESTTTTLDTAPTSTQETAPTSTPENTTPTSTPEVISQTSAPTNNTPAPTTFSTEQINQNTSRINNYLKSQQSSDGKIQDGTATDWAIMSFGSTGQYASDIKNTTTSLLNYEENYELNDPKTINICAGYPRHILAFLAAGIETNHPAIINLRDKIINECYKNNAYGEYGINDDVFALFALLPTGSTINDPVVMNIIDAIKADQTIDGAFTFAGWAGADMTGAAINALKYAQNNGATIDPEIFTHAKQYLKTNQLADGGWGYGASDVLITSWAMMGINALSESQINWVNNADKSPWNVLIDNNKTDGSYESAWVPGTTDWFALQSAVPALLGKTWPIILTAKPQEFHYTGGGGCGNCQPIIEIISPTSTPTTTIAVVTTTVEIATTTTELLSTPTSTIEIIDDIPTTTQKVSPTKKIYSKKIINKITRIPEINKENKNTPPTQNPTEKTKKTSFAQIIASSKNNLINFGHQLLKLLRNVL